MGFSIKRTGFTDMDALGRAIVTDMIAAGFTLTFPAAMSSSAKAFTLQAGANVDPLAASQPWSVKLMWDKDVANRAAGIGGLMDIVVATPMQFKDAVHATYERFYGTPWSGQGVSPNTGVSADVPGVLGTACGRAPAAGSSPGPKDQGYGERMFIDRTRYLTASELLAYPMSYLLSVSDRGFVLFVWEEGHDREGNRYSWVAVQRPVDNKDGKAFITGKAPVHCLYGLVSPKDNPQPWVEGNQVFNIRRFVVREADVNVPYPLCSIGTTYPRTSTDLMGVDATLHTKDYAAVINSSQQVSISEQNKYIISHPNGFNTARYAYAHELDMIAYTSADVVSEGTIIPVQAYGEAVPRKYMALGANGPDNTGMRILALIEGGGVTPAPAAGAGA